MSSSVSCPACGAVLPEGQPKGLCPRCALSALLKEGKGSDTFTPTLTPPTGSLAPSEGERVGVRGSFGDYELLEEIARGGMGIVYRARQKSLDRVVAVKMLLRGEYASEEFIHRFRIEASAAASLQHPNIVAIHEVGVHQGQHYFAMDFVDGPDLARLVRDQPLTAQRAAGYVKIIAEAIHFAHTRRILHRDLKPSNVLIDSNDQPRVTDFGLAKNLGNDSDLTVTGQVMGSPSFMPPEQALGERGKMGPASDVYSLGAILYHALTGRAPFVGQSVADTLQQVESKEPIAPRLLIPSVPADLETICLKCLEKEPGKRFESALKLSDELGRFLRDEPIESRPVSAPEKLWRWCRRKPAIASLGGATILLLLAVAIGSPIAAFRVDRERQRAEGNAKRAEHNAEKEAQERQRAETIDTQLEIQRAQDLFATEDVSAALSYLARVLRQRPTNQVAAARILSALTQRNFALPLTPPLPHEAEVRFAAFSPNGQRVATASNDKTARLWDARSGAPVGPPLPHDAEVVWLDFSPDGEWLATASLDKTARIWNVRTGAQAASPLRHTGAVRSAQFSPNGLWVLTTSGKTARVWNAQTGEPAPHVFQHTVAVAYAEFSSDGEWVATASARTARVWNARTGEPRTPPLPHGGTVGFVRFSPDGELVATAAADSTGRVWDAATGRAVTGPLLHKNRLTPIEFSPDGRRVVTCPLDATAQMWDARTGQSVGASLRHDSFVNSAQFSPDGQYLVTASADRTVRLWNVEAGQLFMHPLQHAHRVNRATFDPDGLRVVSASDDKTAQIWDVQEGRPSPVRLQHQDTVYSPQFSPDGRLVATASGDRTARVWNAQTGQAVTEPLQHAGGVFSVRFSPDGRYVATASRDSTARVWNAVTGQPVTPPLPHRNLVHFADFSPDGERVVTASSDRTAGIWETTTGKLLLALKGHGGTINRASFSPNGSWIVTVSADSTARIWDARTGKPLGQSLRHEGTVNTAQFSSDGERIVTASEDTTAMIWDTRTSRPLTRPLKHDGNVRWAMFNPDGTKVLTAAFDKTARVWDARTGQPLTEPLKHPDNLRHAHFSPDGQRVLTSCEDGAARIWDAQTGQMLSEPYWHEGAVVFADFSPDGQWIVTASEDKTARLWEVPQTPLPIPSWLAELAEAMASGRFDDHGNLEAVPLSALWEIKAQIQTNSGATAYTRWAQWFFSDRNARNVSPASSLTIAEWVQQRIEKNTVESRLGVESYGTLPRLMRSRGARRILAQGKTTQQMAEDAASRRAVEAEILERGSNSVSAVAWTAKGGMLERDNQPEPALSAYSRAIEISAAGPGSTGGARSNALFHRWNLLRRLGRFAEAQTDFLLLKGIPARDPQSKPNLIDLSAHYTAGLEEDWLGRKWKGNNLSNLPKGRTMLKEVEFDLRGIVQLAGPSLDKTAPGFPDQVKGIQIGRHCQRLHFLHATGWGNQVKDRTQIGAYVIQYADGQKLDIPIVVGEDLREWQVTPRQTNDLERATAAWKGKIPMGGYAQLFKRTWDNPHPKVEIKSVDFTSAKTAAAPFLIAITAE